jgi:hypothetical protein
MGFQEQSPDNALLLDYYREATLRLTAAHPGALTADQRQFYDVALVLGRGDRQTTTVITKMRWSAVG